MDLSVDHSIIKIKFSKIKIFRLMCVVRLCWIELGMNRREFWSNEDIARKMKDNSLR